MRPARHSTCNPQHPRVKVHLSQLIPDFGVFGIASCGLFQYCHFASDEPATWSTVRWKIYGITRDQQAVARTQAVVDDPGSGKVRLAQLKVPASGETRTAQRESKGRVE